MESDGRGDAAAGIDAAGGMERLEREAIDARARDIRG